jgi:glyoxylase I family protein
VLSFSGIAHVALVVRDMARSVDWYERVLGFERHGEVRPGPPEAGHPRQLMRHPDSGLVLGIHEPLDHSDDTFDPSRAGLDHLALAARDRADLEEWLARLDELKVPHSPVRDIGYARFVSVFDPDGIQWELWALTSR